VSPKHTTKEWEEKQQDPEGRDQEKVLVETTKENFYFLTIFFLLLFSMFVVSMDREKKKRWFLLLHVSSRTTLGQSIRILVVVLMDYFLNSYSGFLLLFLVFCRRKTTTKIELRSS